MRIGVFTAGVNRNRSQPGMYIRGCFPPLQSCRYHFPDMTFPQRCVGQSPVICLMLMCGQGCQTTKPPQAMPAPTTLLSQDYYLGTVLSGWKSGSPPVSFSEVHELRARLQEIAVLG